MMKCEKNGVVSGALYIPKREYITNFFEDALNLPVLESKFSARFSSIMMPTPISTCRIVMSLK